MNKNYELINVFVDPEITGQNLIEKFDCYTLEDQEEAQRRMEAHVKKMKEYYSRPDIQQAIKDSIGRLERGELKELCDEL